MKNLKNVINWVKICQVRNEESKLFKIYQHFLIFTYKINIDFTVSISPIINETSETNLILQWELEEQPSMSNKNVLSDAQKGITLHLFHFVQV